MNHHTKTFLIFVGVLAVAYVAAAAQKDEKKQNTKALPQHRDAKSLPAVEMKVPKAVTDYAARMAKVSKEYGPKHRTVSKTNGDGLELAITIPETIISGHPVYTTVSVKNKSKQCPTTNSIAESGPGHIFGVFRRNSRHRRCLASLGRFHR